MEGTSDARNSSFSRSLVVGACKWTEFDDLAGLRPGRTRRRNPTSSRPTGASRSRRRQSSGRRRHVARASGTDRRRSRRSSYNARRQHQPRPRTRSTSTSSSRSARSPDPPILLDDPDSDEVALVIPTLDGRTLVEGGTANMPTQLGVIVDPTPLAATYVAMGSTQSPIVVAAGTVNGSRRRTTCTSCRSRRTRRPRATSSTSTAARSRRSR